MAEYIDKNRFLASMGLTGDETKYGNRDGKHMNRSYSTRMAYEIMDGVEDSIVEEELVPVVSGYHEGDVCIYGFGHENKSRAIVEIVRILNDERGVAEVKFHKVFVDDTGNGFFNYLLKSGNTMNASFKYLKNITPRMDGE